MEIFGFNEALIEQKSQLFPNRIEDDKWILYHGTSNISERSIEEDGLFWSSAHITQSVCQEVVAIFDEINWRGLHPGGYGVLKGFTCGDFERRSNKGVFLALSSFRASLYATREFLGGESVRAMAYALSDLRKFLDDKAVRFEYEEGRFREYQELKKLGAKVEDVRPVDLGSLQGRLHGLKDVEEYLYGLQKQYEYGVVYAIKFDSNSVAGLENRNSMGIIAYDKIHPERIVSKVLIPNTWEKPTMKSDLRNRSRTLSPEGILKLL